MAGDNLYESPWPEPRTFPAKPRPLPNRACAECRRKKSKCDMKRPECSLCHRIGETCIYPTRRAHRRKRAEAQSNEQTKQSSMICYPSPSISQENLPSQLQPGLFDSFMQHENNLFSPPIPSSADPFLTNDSLLNMGFDFLNTTPEQLRALSDADDLNPWPEEQHRRRSTTSVGGMYSTQSTCRDQQTPTTISTTQHGPNSIITLERSSLPQSQGYTLNVSPEMALDLIDGFFNHIHCFLPLFHPARFKEKYAALDYLKGEQDCGITLESALILNGIFCLAARFSTASKFSAEEPLHRGDQFATEAARLFEVLYRQLEDDHPSLACLQGVILLAFSALLSGPGPSRRAWWLTGVCVRLAYELDLHNTDADIICGDVDQLQLPLEVWQDREERRHAWWLVWDLDTFIGATMLRPFAINRRGMQVLLPISDEAWLASDRLPSSHLDPESTTPWKGLCDLQNQSTWAWFLASMVLLRQVVEVVLLPNADRELDRVEASCKCFALALPESFRADLEPVNSDGSNVKGVNWVKSTLSLFNCCEIRLAVRRRTLNASNILGKPMPRKDNFSSFPDSHPLLKNDYCDKFKKEMAQVAQTCPPQNLAQMTPFITICLVGPAFVHLRGNRLRDSNSIDDLNIDILIFALKRLARHWMIARVLLDELNQFRKDENIATSVINMKERKAGHFWFCLVV